LSKKKKRIRQEMPIRASPKFLDPRRARDARREPIRDLIKQSKPCSLASLKRTQSFKVRSARVAAPARLKEKLRKIIQLYHFRLFDAPSIRFAIDVFGISRIRPLAGTRIVH